MLKIQSISKNFGGIQALRDCSIDITKNKITALIGPNGAGKTTLFDIVSGLVKPNKGKVIFENRNIASLSPHIIANLGMARTFQKVQLFKNLTIKDHLLIPQDNQDTKIFSNAIGLNKISRNKIDRIKNILEKLELDKPLETQITDLSYGQRKLLDLAMALFKPHKLLLLDEPVEGVSPKIRKKIEDIFFELKKEEGTAILIEHDINFVSKISDWVVVLDKGTVLWQGKPEEIKKKPEILEAYLGK